MQEWEEIGEGFSLLSEQLREEVIERIKKIGIAEWDPEPEDNLLFQKDCLLECVKYAKQEDKIILLWKALVCCEKLLATGEFTLVGKGRVITSETLGNEKKEIQKYKNTSYERSRL